MPSSMWVLPTFKHGRILSTAQDRDRGSLYATMQLHTSLPHTGWIGITAETGFCSQRAAIICMCVCRVGHSFSHSSSKPPVASTAGEGNVLLLLRRHMWHIFCRGNFDIYFEHSAFILGHSFDFTLLSPHLFLLEDCFRLFVDRVGKSKHHFFSEFGCDFKKCLSLP